MQTWKGIDVEILVLFERIGPYHHARLKSVHGLSKVKCIEMWKKDATYSWDLINDDNNYHRISLIESESSVKKSALNKKLIHELGQCSPDVVVIPGWSESWALAALEWCRVHNVPSILLSESTQYDFKRAKWKELVKSKLVRMFSATLVGGKPHLEYIQSLGLPSNRTLPGYDVVDNEHFKLGATQVRLQAEELRAKHGLPEKYIVCSNRFIEKKNLPRLLDAYALYLQQRGENPWDLVMLGDGALRPALEDKISELGLSEHVHMLGFKQYHELPIYYGLASAFVHASTSEQWGLVVNEAMASGLPVILSYACGCAQDLVEEGRNGFTFNPYDVNKLANLMLHVSSEECDREAMGRASQEIISQWTPELFAKNLKALAEMVLASPRPRAGMLDKLLLKALIHR